MQKKHVRLFFYICFSIIIGTIVGVIDSIFSIGLNFVSDFRGKYFIYLIPFLSIIGVFIIYSYKKFGKNSIRGMGYVFDSAFKEDIIIPKRLIPFAIISTWLTHLFGGSAGREGVAVQIGATISNSLYTFLEKRLNINLKEFKQILISTGISAGFAGLFGTPFAATIFSLEVLHMGTINYSALFPTLLSAFVALTVSNLFGIKHFHFKVNNIPDFNINMIIPILVTSLCFAITGFLFAFLLHKLKKNKVLVEMNPILKIFLGGIFISITISLIHMGRYSGLGTNLISSAFNNQPIYSYDWILKVLFTVITLAVGFQGGEVTPLFAIGASLGASLALYFNLPIPFLASIGYCSVFGAATNTFLAPFLIGIEVFGYDMCGYLFVSCAIAYLFSGQLSIYDGQKKTDIKY